MVARNRAKRGERWFAELVQTLERSGQPVSVDCDSEAHANGLRHRFYRWRAKQGQTTVSAKWLEALDSVEIAQRGTQLVFRWEPDREIGALRKALDKVRSGD